MPRNSDMGIDLFMEEITKCIRESEISNDKISRDRVIQRIDEWILGFETNPEVIRKRQDVVKYALQHPQLLQVIEHISVYPDQSTERDDKFSHYAGKMRRFETFAESVAALKAANCLFC